MFKSIMWMIHRKSLLKQVKGLCEMQALSGNWDHDPYMHGMFNGMEMIRALLENRPPEFRKIPAEGYICDTKVDPVQRDELIKKMIAIAKDMPDDFLPKDKGEPDMKPYEEGKSPVQAC